MPEPDRGTLLFARPDDGRASSVRPFGRVSRPPAALDCLIVETDVDVEDVDAFRLNGGTGGLGVFEVVVVGLIEGLASSANSGLR